MKRFLLTVGLSVSFLAAPAAAMAGFFDQTPPAPPASVVPGPYFPGEQAVTYIRRCITGSLSFTNVDWKENISAFRDCYSPDGWRRFGRSLAESGIVDGTVYSLGRVETRLDGESSFAKDENGVPTLWLDTPVEIIQWQGELSGSDERHVTSVRRFVVRVELTPTGVEGRDSVVINRLIARGQ